MCLVSKQSVEKAIHAANDRYLAAEGRNFNIHEEKRRQEALIEVLLR